MTGYKLTRRDRLQLLRIGIVLAMFIVVFVVDKTVGLDSVVNSRLNWLLPFALYLIIYVIIAYDVLFKAFRNFVHGQVFDENFLMCIASLGAFALAIYRGVTGQEIEGFDEACAVLIFYQAGEFFQSYATNRSRKSIASLMDIRPDYANVLNGSEITTMDPSEVKIDDIILINPGERVPLDGVVIKGASTLDTKALTGESVPRDVGGGDNILSGVINLTSQIEVRVTKEFYNSTVSKILELVENASSQKSKTENFITKFAKYYTPIVVFIALALIIIPSAITGEWSLWVYRGLSFLVVSCPCALVISVPLSFFSGLGASSKYGILIKGSSFIEQFNKANVFVFDKTGTLTKGNFKVDKVLPIDKRDSILRLASIAEQSSNHPIARSILQEYNGEIDGGYTLTNIAGEGVIAINNDGDTIYCGNEKLMLRYGIDYIKHGELGTVVYVARNNTFEGLLCIIDEIKCESSDVINNLHEMNCATYMLSGDSESIAQSVSDRLSLTGYKASLLPQDKMSEVEGMLDNKHKGDMLCFVGDGINDAPTLMRADVGIAMGALGADAAIEAADIVLMNDDLRGIPLAKKIAKKTMSVVWQNIIVSIIIKVVILILSAMGITNMWVAVFGDVGVAVLAILNAMRVNGKYYLAN